MTAENERSEMVRYWWSRSLDSLASARREVEAGSYAFAMNRLYYAAFYSVSAALLEREQSFKKHSGVRAAFIASSSRRAFSMRSGGVCTISFSRIGRKGTTLSSSLSSRNTCGCSWANARSSCTN